MICGKSRIKNPRYRESIAEEAGFYNRDLKKKHFPKQKFFPFSNLQISLEKGKFFATIFTKRSKNSFNPAFLAILC